MPLAENHPASSEGPLFFLRRTEKEKLRPATGLTAGRTVGDFHLVAQIGQGGMGQVWEAQQLSLKRRVAVKFVRPECVTAHQLDLFGREARAGGRLSHPGIVAVFGYGESDGLAWIAMEFVDGAWTLKDFLDESARLAEVPVGYDRHVAELVAKIAEAMQFAHEARVIHRDLKPQNVLITADDQPKIGDFGLARITDEAALSTTGDFAGTYLYMSPEQALAKRMGIDHRTDIFSLGVVLYELLAQRRPFGGDTPHQVAEQIVTHDPPDLRTLRSKIPRDLAVIAGKALEKARDKRFQSMREFAADLRRHLANEPIHARPPTRRDRIVKWAMRNPGRSSAAVIASVALALITLLLVANVRAKRDLLAANADLSSERTNLASANTALAAKTVESEVLRKDAEAKRDEVLKLSALQELDDLLAQVDGLWPAYPEIIPRYEKWIRDAELLLAELSVHRESRAELRSKALAQSAEERSAARADHPEAARLVELEAEVAGAADAAAAATGAEAVRSAEERLARLEQQRDDLEAELSQRRDWRFPEEEPEARWWNNQLTKLIEELEGLERGLLAADGTSQAHGWSVPRRLAFARSIATGFAEGGEHERRWSEALPEIRAAYPGLSLSPQQGLVPIGPDPEGGLWEFAHLQTGAIAQRGGDGRLVLQEDTGLVFVLLPAGTFWMGAQGTDPDKPNYDPQARAEEGPVREIAVSAFFLSKYEMTQGQWLRFVGSRPSIYQSPNRMVPSLLHPVEQVSWNSSKEVCERLDLVLPTEAQWEYGARGGTSSVWWTGDERESLLGVANLADQAAARGGADWDTIMDWPELDDGYCVHAPVDRFAPNPFGLHNVHGNVLEWCPDGVYRTNFSQASEEEPVSDPAGFASRIFRGGSFDYAAAQARSAKRFVATPDHLGGNVGLRPAREITR